MKHPLLPYALLLAAGIYLADGWTALSPQLAVAIGAGLAVLSIATQWMKGKRLQHWSFALLAGVAVVFLGYARMAATRPVSTLSTDLQHHEFAITTTPERTTHAYRAMAQVQGERVMLYFDEPPQKGDHLLAYCQLREPAPPANPHQFDYRRYLLRKGICHTSYLHEDEYIVTQRSNNFVLHLRERVFRAFQSADLTPEQRGIAEALVLGYDSDVFPETQRLFRNAGITHLLCVSGLHVGIVSAILASLLFWLIPYGRWYRHLKGLAQIAGIWAFACFTGFAPSTVRAATMFSFAITGRLLSTQNSTLNNIAASALLMLIVQPGQLFDIGFQLSYAAVLGIILFDGELKRLWSPSFRPLKTLWSLISLSTAAQITCTPIIFFYFNQFTPHFLIANVLIVPFAGIILGSCFLLALTAWWPWLFSLITQAVSWELIATDWVTRLVSSLPYALIENICFPAPMLWLSIAIILVGYGVLAHRSRPLLYLFAGLSSLLILNAIALSVHHGRQESLIFYSAPRTTAIEHQQGHHSTLYLNDSVDISYQRQAHLSARGIHHTDTLYGQHLIHYQNKTLYIVDRQTLPLLRDTFPIHIDYLIVSETPWLTPPELRQVVDYDTLVITPNNSPNYTPLWRALCHRDSIPFFDLTQSGAIER